MNNEKKSLNRENILKATGIVLKRERKKCKISQAELAKDSGLSKNTVSNIEIGKISPTIETLFNIFANLETDLESYIEMVKIEFNHLEEIDLRFKINK